MTNNLPIAIARMVPTETLADEDTALDPDNELELADNCSP